MALQLYQSDAPKALAGRLTAFNAATVHRAY